jgi:hypothetical protein
MCAGPTVEPMGPRRPTSIRGSHSSLMDFRRAVRWVWSYRTWAYAAYMLFAVARIPARTGFRLHTPACDTRLTLHNAQLSMTKVPHIVLFGFFFLLTALQFDHVDRRMLGWSFVATVVLGLLVEVEEGATRTGNCRLTDVLPDAVGALIAMALVISIAAVVRRFTYTSAHGAET